MLKDWLMTYCVYLMLVGEANSFLTHYPMQGVIDTKLMMKKVDQRKMTDQKWHKIIIKCKAACDEHLRLLKIAEDEYFQRYGNAPSDVNDDWWIDTLHYGRGSTDLDLEPANLTCRKQLSAIIVLRIFKGLTAADSHPQ